jgi:hypothetical protein
MSDMFGDDILAMADAYIAPSTHLLSHLPADKPHILRQTVMGEEAIDVLSTPTDRHNRQTFNIGVLGGGGRKSHGVDIMSEIVNEIGRWATGNDHTITLKYFSAKDTLQPAGWCRVERQNFFRPADWRGLYGRFVGMDLGCVLNVLDESDEFCRCKSGLKWLESAAMGVPLVTSRVPPYTEFATDGKNLVLASSPSEFAARILELARNTKVATEIGDNAKRLMLTDFNCDGNAKRFADDLVAAMNMKRRKDMMTLSENAKPRKGRWWQR